MRDADNGNNCGSQPEKKREREPVLTRLGIDEVKYMRPSRKGNYTPTIHEIEDLIIDGSIGRNEARVLLFIKSRTVNFRNTDIRLKRKDLSKSLGLAKNRLSDAIKNLTEGQYLIEKADVDDYYFYGLNPDKFDGLIVMRSQSEFHFRVNRSQKTVAFLESYRPGKGNKLLPHWIQNVTPKVTNCYPNEASTVGNYSALEMLKYILLKYIYLNGLSADRGELILEIVNGIRNPEYLIKQFVALIQSSPLYGRAITDELVRSDSTKTDGFNRPLKSNPLAYIVACWTELSPHFHNVPHPTFDKSQDKASLRKEHADWVAEFPIEMNQSPAKVFEFKKT